MFWNLTSYFINFLSGADGNEDEFRFLTLIFEIEFK